MRSFPPPTRSTLRPLATVRFVAIPFLQSTTTGLFLLSRLVNVYRESAFEEHPLTPPAVKH